MRKFLKILFCFIFIIFALYSSCLHFLNLENERKEEFLVEEDVFCATSNTDDIEQELEENINDQLNKIEFGEIEDLINNLDAQTKFVFSSNSFLDIVKKFITGEDTELFSSFVPYALNLVFSNILQYVPYFAIIIAIAIVYSIISGISSEKNKSISSLINIVCFSAIAVIILSIILQLLKSSLQSIQVMERLMEIIFPIILTLITAIGSVVTASSFQPLLVVLSSGITKIFTVVLIPIFIFSIIFGIIGNLSKNIKLDKFSKFFSSLFNWIIGIVFTIFMSFLTLQGLTVSSIDTISIKTAKFAIKNYIPIVGSYLADGMGLIVASSVLIKNAIGISGILLLFSVVFLPVIQIAIVGLLLKLTSAILEPVCDKEVSDFLFSISKSLNMLIVCLVAIGFMFLISVSLLMCCANVVF